MSTAFDRQLRQRLQADAVLKTEVLLADDGPESTDSSHRVYSLTSAAFKLRTALEAFLRRVYPGAELEETTGQVYDASNESYVPAKTLHLRIPVGPSMPTARKGLKAGCKRWVPRALALVACSLVLYLLYLVLTPLDTKTTV